ncbi:MAG: peptidase S41 [Lachnospiraceae bacterium]|nr:peptidase S41 [Lachnospiraceae bacterium]
MILYDKILIGIVVGGALFLYILAGVAVRVISNKWRAVYCVPVLAGMLLLAMCDFEISMLGAYLGAVILLAGFIKDSVKVRRRACVAAAVLGLVTIPVCMMNKGYRCVNYVQDFKDGVASMKDHYILAEHKGVDLDALYETYLPMFEEANRNHDEVQNYIAWASFTAEFHDGHIGFLPNEEETMQAAYERVCGNDYGLALMTLEDGRTVAVNVEENDFFREAGIHNGTVITSWDGYNIAEVAKETLAYHMFAYPLADKDNEDFCRDLFAAGVGGDSVKITYLDDSNVEKELVLPKLGNYYERLKDTLEIINQGVETGHMMWAEIDEETVCLRIKLMMYDSETSKTENYGSMQAEIRAKAEEYKAAGKKHLILDLRGNGGGSGQMVKALASLFAPKGEYYYCTDGLWDDKSECYLKDATGHYVPGKEHYFRGENIWDGPVTILVNSSSISAADHLTKVMQGMENVTIMGFTEPNGSGQGVGSCLLESGELSFSGSLLLDRNGDIFVDSGVDRESTNDIDVQIPFDENAVRVLFDEGGDYVLQKCMEYRNIVANSACYGIIDSTTEN